MPEKIAIIGCGYIGTALACRLLGENKAGNGPYDLGITATILRLCGIYGPDRGPQRFAHRFSGQVRTDGEAYLNLVHRDDIVEALYLLLHKPYPGVLNLNDDCPTTRREYYDRLLSQAGPHPQWLTSA